MHCQVLNANLANPDLQFRCGSATVGGISRTSCQWPFRCCAQHTVPRSPREHDKPRDPDTATTKGESEPPHSPVRDSQSETQNEPDTVARHCGEHYKATRSVWYTRRCVPGGALIPPIIISTHQMTFFPRKFLECLNLPECLFSPGRKEIPEKCI